MSSEPLLRIENLKVRVDEKPILQGVTLRISSGEVVALMGPNGSGKSTLASVLMGHPSYTTTEGTIIYKGKNVLDMKPEERAEEGIFLSFQYPQEIAGVTIGNFLRLAYNAVHRTHMPVLEFLSLLKEKMKLVGIPEEFLHRSVNEGFSGGEKKKAEMLQLAVLEPNLAILDETDSGLDVDALKIVGKTIAAVRTIKPSMAILLITHYQRILQYIPADRVAIMKEGKIVAQGDQTLLQRIEEQGYTAFV